MTNGMTNEQADRRSGAWRSRWAAVGAAVAVTLGAGGMIAVNAAPSAESSFVSIDPTRILDTRSDVGLVSPPASGTSAKLQVTGTVPTQPPGGAPAVSAEVVPAEATAVIFNATVVRPSTKGFLSIRPGSATGTPATSNINWAAGGANIANSVTVQLPTSGQIDIFVNGSVGEVLLDVAGYYLPAAGGVSAVTMQTFEVQMGFGGSQTIAENGDLSLSLRCREDDQSPDLGFSATNRNNMQFRAFSTGKYMTTFPNDRDLYSGEGATLARALGSSAPDQKVQTTFLQRDLGDPSGATMTAADGRQIVVDGDSVQVMFNVDDPAVTGGASVDCYARGIVMLVPGR